MTTTTNTPNPPRIGNKTMNNEQQHDHHAKQTQTKMLRMMEADALENNAPDGTLYTVTNDLYPEETSQELDSIGAVYILLSAMEANETDGDDIHRVRYGGIVIESGTVDILLDNLAKETYLESIDHRTAEYDEEPNPLY